MTPFACSSPNTVVMESPSWTVMITSLPLPAKMGSICRANQATATTTTTRIASTTRPSGLVNMKAIYVVLQHDHRGGAVNVTALVLGPNAGLGQ